MAEAVLLYKGSAEGVGFEGVDGFDTWCHENTPDGERLDVCDWPCGPSARLLAFALARRRILEDRLAGASERDWSVVNLAELHGPRLHASTARRACPRAPHSP